MAQITLLRNNSNREARTRTRGRYRRNDGRPRHVSSIPGRGGVAEHWTLVVPVASAFPLAKIISAENTPRSFARTVSGNNGSTAMRNTVFRTCRIEPLVEVDATDPCAVEESSSVTFTPPDVTVSSSASVKALRVSAPSDCTQLAAKHHAAGSFEKRPV